MPGQKLPAEKLARLKSKIREELEKNQSIPANKLHENIRKDPSLGSEISLGMIQNHLGNIRKELSADGRKRNGRNVESKVKQDITDRAPRRTRLSIDKRVHAVHIAAKEAERLRLAFEKAEANLHEVEAELRQALERSLGERGSTLFAGSRFSEEDASSAG